MHLCISENGVKMWVFVPRWAWPRLKALYKHLYAEAAACGCLGFLHKELVIDVEDLKLFGVPFIRFNQREGIYVLILAATWHEVSD